MKNSIELSNQKVQLMRTEIEEVFSQVYDQILDSQESANNIFTQVLSDYEGLFASDNINPCVKKDTKTIKNITSNGQNILRKCFETTINEVDNIRKSITPYIESINSSMNIINKVSEQCSRSSDEIAIGICVTQNVCSRYS